MLKPPPFPTNFDPVADWSRRDPRRIALVDRPRDRRFTYAELDRDARRWASFLHGRGVRRSSRVAVLARNRAELIALFFACRRLRAALVPLNWRLPAPELAPVLASARPELLLGEEAFRRTAETALAEGIARCGWIDLDAAASGLPEPASTGGARGRGSPHDPALVLYTSGSTGRPKGALIPERQIFYNAVATGLAWELGARDTAPLTTPLFHTGGWNVFLLPLLYHGGRVVLPGEFDPDDLLETLAEERCTVAMAVPAQLVAMTESERWGRVLPELRFLISGGAPCPPALRERVRAAGYRFREGYGLTECGPNCFAISNEEADRNPGAVGRPVPFLETRRVRPDGGRVRPDEPGELWLRGPQLFAGYLGDAEATARAIAPGGWLRTGDIFRETETGVHRVCGRSKEMYISGGENVFPGEVEAVLSDHGAVTEIAVIGVPHPRWGEVGRAFIVARGDSAADSDALTAFARERLAGYKVPKSIEFLAALPRLGSGKLDRASLRARSAS